MDIRLTPIEPDYFYHIYNRGINGEKIFKNDRNYRFFLEKLKANLLPVCDIFAYCLMPNHFHLLVRIKSQSELENFVGVSNSAKDKYETGLHAAQNIFSKQFSRIFNSYSQGFNKENGRHGALIESPFKRKIISSEEYLAKCIVYIHKNPVNGNYGQYPYSSYKAIISGAPTSIMREEVLEIFGDRENFIFCHEEDGGYEF